ncbi:MAG: hypothetical protein R3272_16365 [Candidatus Promineifilaceae bacterium]|nr:hypothetical protein [Candidatus Promineifilaceae bacterium]
MNRSAAYRTYIIRAWTEQHADCEKPVWRFRLQDVERGSERGFAGADALLDFLKDELSRGGLQERGPPPPEK